jgi:hypothetical protein
LAPGSPPPPPPSPRSRDQRMAPPHLEQHDCLDQRRLDLTLALAAPPRLSHLTVSTRVSPDPDQHVLTRPPC